MTNEPHSPAIAAQSFSEGWNVGAVSVKRVRLYEDGTVISDVRKHSGDPARTLREMLGDEPEDSSTSVVVTGPLAPSLLSLPYLPESVCVEAALKHFELSPDIVLSLGGETFVVYCLAGGTVRNMLSNSRCAAGSGEFSSSSLPA